MSRSHSRISLLSFALAFFLLLNAPAAGQIFEEIYIVDSPTAGILPHGGYLFQGSVGPRSSLLFGVKIGFHDRLLLGVSFGLQDFIGRGDISVNDKPGFEFRIRIIEEQVVGPALAIGIDTQGEDSYIESSERYERKSKGFYAALSKNYELLRDFSIHGGLNYSLETKDEKGINFFGGVSMEVVAGLSILLDYNAAIDDDDPDVRIRLADNPDVLSRPTRGRGYLDTGVCFNYMENLRIKILFRDLLGNYMPEKGVARSIEIFYINYF